MTQETELQPDWFTLFCEENLEKCLLKKECERLKAQNDTLQEGTARYRKMYNNLYSIYKGKDLDS